MDKIGQIGENEQNWSKWNWKNKVNLEDRLKIVKKRNMVLNWTIRTYLDSVDKIGQLVQKLKNHRTIEREMKKREKSKIECLIFFWRYLRNLVHLLFQFHGKIKNKS